MPKARFTVTLDTTCEFDLEYDGTPNGFVAAQHKVFEMPSGEMVELAARQAREVRYNVRGIGMRTGEGGAG